MAETDSVAPTSTVRVYRPRTVHGRGLAFEVRIDGRPVGRLNTGQHLTQRVQPGKRSVQLFAAPREGGPGALSSHRSWPLEFEVKPGDVVALHALPGFGTVPVAQPGSVPVFETPNGGPDDVLMLTLEGYFTDSDPPPPPPSPSRRPTLLALIAVLLALAALFLTAPLGADSPVRIGVQVLAPVAMIALAVMAYRRLRHPL